MTINFPDFNETRSRVFLSALHLEEAGKEFKPALEK